ncbi:thioredoxin [Nocardioides sp. Root1257]|uniref:thioredoxin family protein n=1 Tax=unclassified Nocardioides TaxID=2615069 RepID=UPI0006FE4F3E|nr:MULTISPECIES: thioredoxin family protein [unclassified Nocardioides]KQW48536.1 thioredoxin [Nocardioides sp. Root1257]KRC47712.1 thioredoxin [Nocardioides sp. Root224]
MSSGAWVVVVAVVLGLSFGAYRLLTDGRFRGTHRVRRAASVVEEGALAPVSKPPTPWDDVLTALPDARLGEKATLLQFSSAFCAPCRATRRTLSEVAELVPGVEHLEVDAEHHLELVRRLGILRTPTTLVLDAAGHEVTRAAGAPRKEQVLSALGSAT